MSPMVSYTEPYAQHIGKKIRHARVTAGMSHDKLVKAAGFPEAGGRQHLIKLEQGKHIPRTDTLRRIADATGRDLSFFIVPAVNEFRAMTRDFDAEAA